MRNWHNARSERLAEEQQARQLAINEATTDLVATADIDGFLISLNLAGYSLLGLDSRANLSSIRMMDLYTNTCSQQMIRYEIPEAINNNVAYSETILKSQEGEEIPCSQVLIAHRDNSGQISFFSLIIRDIRKLREAENERNFLMEQLYNARKMETVGRLAGGIAHDFNNILTVIVGYAELGLLSIDKDGSLKNELEVILDSAQKATRLSNQLLEFSSNKCIEPQVLDINDIVEDTRKLLSSLMGEHIDIQLNRDMHLWPVKMDRSQMEQIILNMAVNAKDAMLDRGTFTISTSNISLDKKQAFQRKITSPGDYVLLSISDDGCGIAEEIQDHIFEPFFTTKVKDKGTGLGLASVHGALRQNNGFINIKSRPGKGCTFDIYLPRVTQADDFSNKPAIANQAAESLPKGNEKILLVDDNEEVLTLLEKMLSDLGYTTLLAKNARMALDYFREIPQEVDMVITDIGLPETDGIDLSRQLKALLPNTRFLFISGHSGQSLDTSELDEGTYDFLGKPFSSQEIANKVRALMDRNKMNKNAN